MTAPIESAQADPVTPCNPPKTPSLAWPILFGIWGALGVTIARARTHRTYKLTRYWVAALVAGIVWIAAIVVLVVALGSAATSGVSGNTSSNPGVQSLPVTGNTPAAQPVGGVIPQPDAPTMTGVVKLIEAERINAFTQHNASLLDEYYLNHSVMGWGTDNSQINDPGTFKVVKIANVKVSGNLTKITADVTVAFSSGGTETDHNTYVAFNKPGYGYRWFLADNT